MFKERLKEVGKFFVALGVVVLLGWLLTFIPSVAAHFAVGILMIILLICLLFGLLFSIISFINWLFVQPYRRYKKDKGVK